MALTRKDQPAWLLFCQFHILRKQARLTFIRGALQHEAKIGVRFVKTYDLECEGDLFGKRYTMEVSSRRRLPGDTKDASRIQFTGKFDQADGVSGEFTIREQGRADLMTIGLYGTPQEIRVTKTDPRAVFSPLEIHGIGDAEIRLETTKDPWHPPATSLGTLPKRPHKHFYVGRCRMDAPAETVPMASLLTTLMLLYEPILVRHYMDPG